MNDNSTLRDGLYAYPIECPACVEKPNGGVKNCATCKGTGELVLRLGEEELCAFYQEYLNQHSQEGPHCPYMSGFEDADTCSVTGAYVLEDK